MNIYQKLAVIQYTLKAPKNQYNSFGKYNYRSCEDIIEAAKPLLQEQNMLLLLKDDIKQIGDRYYVAATALLIDLDVQDSSIEVTAYAREEDEKKGMDGSQVTGASSSYARKYALNGLFAIDDNKDSDNTNKGKKKPTTDQKGTQPTEQPKQKTPRQLLIARLNELGIDVNEYAQKHGLNSKTSPDVFKDLLADLG
jgi:hypothetical protein